MRDSRGGHERRQDILRPLQGIQEALRNTANADNRDSLRGYEGTAALHYFDALRTLLGDDVPEPFHFRERNRRPPRDRFNALLGFGYGLLHTAVMRAVLSVGLEPALGFFHTRRSAAYPLVLHLM